MFKGQRSGSGPDCVDLRNEVRKRVVEIQYLQEWGKLIICFLILPLVGLIQFVSQLNNKSNTSSKINRAYFLEWIVVFLTPIWVMKFYQIYFNNMYFINIILYRIMMSIKFISFLLISLFLFANWYSQGLVLILKNWLLTLLLSFRPESFKSFFHHLLSQPFFS